MRKSWKRILALACAAAMIVPSTAPMSVRAAEELGGTIGDSVIENDNSELPDIANVILSTITDATYDFRVDPDTLLYEFNQDLYDNANMFFANDDGTRTFALPSTYSFYVKTMGLLGANDDAASRTAFENLITLNTTTYTQFVEKLNTTEYYIWQPVDSEFGTGEGAYVRLTEENYGVVIELTVDENDKITAKKMEATPRLSDGDVGAIWDGGIYTPTYTEKSNITTDIVPLFDAENWVFDDSVYVGLKTQPTPQVYYLASDMNISDEIETPEAHADEDYIDIKFTDSKEKYKNESQKASIVNKSTFDIAVTASVQMTGGEGLVLDDDGTFDSGTPGAEIYLAIKDATASGTETKELAAPSESKTAINEAGATVAVTAEAEAHYVLKGTGTTDSVLYTLGEVEELTQSNVYYRYLSADSNSKNTASFSITGATDVRGYAASPNAAAKEAWEAYIQSLADGTATRPQINIVYSFEKVTANAGNTLFANENLDTFTTANISSTGAGWVTATGENKVDFGTADLVYAVGTDTTGVQVSKTADAISIEIAGQTLSSSDDYSKDTNGAITLLDDSPVLATIASTITDGDQETKTMKVTITVNGIKKEFTKDIKITGEAVELTVAGAGTNTNVTLTADPAIIVTGAEVTAALTTGGTTLTLVEGTDYTLDQDTGKVTLLFATTGNQLNGVADTFTVTVKYTVLGDKTVTVTALAFENTN